jgi:hypothetical protein
MNPMTINMLDQYHESPEYISIKESGILKRHPTLKTEYSRDSGDS